MNDFPLLHKQDAEHRVHGAAELYLRELADRLRNDPAANVRTAAAELFERAARSGKAGAALYLALPHRLPETERDNEIREWVFDLVQHGMKLVDARKYVVKHFAERFYYVPKPDDLKKTATLSYSRVKALTIGIRKLDVTDRE